jgi:hypothetical protein
VVTILLFEPDSDSGEFNEAREVDEQLVVSGTDASELLSLKKRSMMLRSLSRLAHPLIRGRG